MRFIIVAIAVFTLLGCSERQLVEIAVSGHPAQAVRYIARHRAQAYEHDPLLFVHDARSLKRNVQRLVRALRGNVGRQWGRRETLLPSRRRYVKYTQNYKSRAVVDFDSGDIYVETVDTTDPQASLQNAIVTTLLTPDDPRAVDMYSDRKVRLSGNPYLYGLVLDQHDRPIARPSSAAAYARYLRRHDQGTRTVTGGTAKRIHYVHFRMVSDHLQLAARRYQPLVRRFAHRYGVSENLVFAIIKTESDFNPFAVSSTPAYGLMQLVPATGGRDAYRVVRGRDGIPAPRTLFQPANNIQLGTAYLGILDHRYLGGIRNPVAREYCTIAAYNTGAGAVLRTFAADHTVAVRRINDMPPSAVYRKLRTTLASAQARRYLLKVLRARREFINL